MPGVAFQFFLFICYEIRSCPPCWTFNYSSEGIYTSREKSTAIDIKQWQDKNMTCLINSSGSSIKPTQSWFVPALEHSQTFFESFSLHGNFSFADHGITFDGSTNFIDTSISASNCLHDPELCSKGFSFGTKMWISNTVKSYTEEKYIIDTGGHHNNTRGVSIFIKNSKLVVEVTTKDTKYKVSWYSKHVLARLRFFSGISMI